jgi:demethylmenaquinone methyltransferase/2-methoxy-6-polyprenyl-1,4-benzoquinol methylase
VQKDYHKIVELVEIKHGDKVLDIAIGIGESAITAETRVKPNGKVVVADISPQVLAIAKARARSLGLDGMMEFRESDGEQLELPESTAMSDTIPSGGFNVSSNPIGRFA